MKRFNSYLTIVTLLIAIAGTAIAAAGFDRLKDRVIVGQGTATDKVIELDIGQGERNPKVVADGTTGAISFSTGGHSPVGAVIAFAGATAPTGWLLADGTCISRSTYAALFSVLSTNYGNCDSGGGANSGFKLPDLRGRVAAGKDDMGGSAANRLTSSNTGIFGNALGAAGGSEQVTGSIGGSQSFSISSEIILWGPGSLVSTNSADANIDVSTTPSSVTIQGSNFTFTDGTGGNAQPTIVLNYIIKA